MLVAVIVAVAFFMENLDSTIIGTATTNNGISTSNGGNTDHAVYVINTVIADVTNGNGIEVSANTAVIQNSTIATGRFISAW